MTPDDFFAFAKKHEAEMVDLKFVDMLGSWQHCSFPLEHLDKDTFKDGLGFDGSSIRGWMGIHESDMLAVPDAETTRLDPFLQADGQRDRRHRRPGDGRVLARSEAHRAEGRAVSEGLGVADTCYIGPEPEFFIFDEVRYEQNQHRGYYQIDSVEGAWNTARIEEPNLGYKPSFKGGYFPVSPTDTYHDLRGEMVYEMRKVGIVVEAHHHEVATAGQSEIDMQFQPLLKMADQFMWGIHLQERREAARQDRDVHAEADLRGQRQRHAHAHVALEGRQASLRRRRYAGLSELGLHAAGGLLKHAPAILAFAAPTTNSYRRLVPGFEAPVNLALSARNRSASIRIPMYSKSPKAKRLEFRCPTRAATAISRGRRC